MTVSAVILAAGSGDRMQTGANKMFMPICGQPLICRTIKAFIPISSIDEFVLVAHPREMNAIKQMTRTLSPRILFVEGGTTRRDSALAGIGAARGDIVLIHDGARPFPSQTLIRDVLSKANQEKAAIPVLPITDLLYQLEPDGDIALHPNLLSKLAGAQTPQGFHRDLILECLQQAPPDIRDDASAVLSAGARVVTVPGERMNIKITHPDDLPLAEAIIAFRGL